MVRPSPGSPCLLASLLVLLRCPLCDLGGGWVRVSRGPPSQGTTNWVVENNRHRSPHSRGGRMSKLQVSAEPCSLCSLQGRSPPASSQRVWLRQSSASGLLRTALQLCLCPNRPLLAKTPVLGPAPKPTRGDLTLADHICKDLFPNMAPCTGLHVDMNSKGHDSPQHGRSGLRDVQPELSPLSWHLPGRA